ncbi:MAG: beta-lactamase family protein [Candidatus Sumerlaeia bacterium]|nr:beta-lactamase family protein [Candidatus Sumerlaeia bacterium]
MKIAKTLVTMTVAALVAITPLASEAIVETESEISPRLDAIVKQGIEEHFYPGAVLIVGTPDEILHARAYGTFTWEEESQAVSLDTIFDLASVSKAAGTATAAWVLMEEGVINPDDKVTDYVPAFEANEKGEVTLRDLLTHVSGLKSYENASRVEQTRGESESPAEALIRTYANLPLTYTPREGYTYSCLNFQLLAHVLEQAAGERLESILRRAVWEPLGMEDSAYILNDAQWQRTAPTHRNREGEMIRSVHDPLAKYHGSLVACPGNAGMFSTAVDMARYCAMILQNGSWDGQQIFKPETIEYVTRRHTPEAVSTDRGLGLDIFQNPPYVTRLNNEDGARIVGHLGYTGTLIWMDTHSNTYFVFLTNRTYPHAESAGDQSPNIARFRNRVCDTVLRSRPEYQEYFAQQEEKEETETE